MEKSIEEKLERIGRWWKGENRKPIIFLTGKKREEKKVDLNQFWKTPESQPDFEKIVENQIESIKNIFYFGEAYPKLSHRWGNRGTPMTMAAYMGGKVVFGEDTVWVDKVIDNWEKFEIKFDKNKRWVKMSKELMERQIEKLDGEFLIEMPDIGDALTCFSLLRGPENLLFDIVEIPELIVEKVKNFAYEWIEAHKFFHEIYRKKLRGDTSWLIWAPGKTYACQCDFSTMISPDMFEKFVLPELEILKDYLEFIAWHLDGPGEIKHLDILLSLSYVKAIQIVPGAGKPPCASDFWLPVIKKIIESGKNVIIYAENDTQLEILLDNLPSEKLLIILTYSYEKIEENQKIIEWIMKKTT